MLDHGVPDNFSKVRARHYISIIIIIIIMIIITISIDINTIIIIIIIIIICIFIAPTPARAPATPTPADYPFFSRQAWSPGPPSPSTGAPASLDVSKIEACPKIYVHHWLPDGVRTTMFVVLPSSGPKIEDGGVLTRVPQILNILSYCYVVYSLPRMPCMPQKNMRHVATVCHLLYNFATNFDYGKWRHFCDDPVCPDPVWKLSSSMLQTVTARGTPTPSSNLHERVLITRRCVTALTRRRATQRVCDVCKGGVGASSAVPDKRRVAEHPCMAFDLRAHVHS